MTEQWMSIVEYARTFSVSDMTVRRRIKTGKLRAVLRDGKYFIPIDSAVQEKSNNVHFNKEISNSSESYSNVHHQGASASELVNAEVSWGKNNSGYHRDVKENSDTIELTKMLDYCYRSLNRINSIERHLNDTYSEKLGNLESQIRHKDLEISTLKQQLEDLQILIKMYDMKKSN